MDKFILVTTTIMTVSASSGFAQEFESDIIKTSAGDLTMTFIGHGTLMFEFDGKIIHIDPWTSMADYSKLPKADIILLTHNHPDHLDLKALTQTRTEKTQILLPENCASQVEGGIIMKNGDEKIVGGLKIEAVPAYNIVHMRSGDMPFHPKGEGNGYIITCGDKRVYVAGDTENTPELKALEEIDVAFLPMNLPYTMTPEMAADAAKAFKPKIFYPYHFGETDTSILVDLLEDRDGIDVRIRKLQ
jgi:L-ascorbate metabolism protein UlaG (beta-lactamase superfamily)